MSPRTQFLHFLSVSLIYFPYRWPLLEAALPLGSRMAATVPEGTCCNFHTWQEIKQLCSSIYYIGPKGHSNWIDWGWGYGQSPQNFKDPGVENRVCKEGGRWTFGKQSTKIPYTSWLNLIFTTLSRLAQLLLPLTDRETEVQRGHVIYLSSHRVWLEPGVKPGWSDSKPAILTIPWCFPLSFFFF